VAILVHDFSSDVGEDELNGEALDCGRTKYSITLNGIVREEHGELEAAYRAIHLNTNKAYEQFILGEDNAIITVEIIRCRVCDINDSVRHWSRSSDAKDSEWTESS